MSLDSRSVSRWLAAAGLLLAPILFALSDLIEPAWSDDSAEYLREVASGTNRHLAWGALWAVGGVALLAGMIGVARLLRGGAVGVVGAWMVGVSAAVVGGLLLALAVTEVAMVDEARDRPEMVALYDGMEDVSLALIAFGVLFFGGFGLGTLLVAVGLLIRRPVPIWSPLLLIVWLVVIVASPNRWVNLAALVLILGAFAPVAARIAGMANEQWARWQPLPDGERRPARRARELQPSGS
jgi:hypothetical protein